MSASSNQVAAIAARLPMPANVKVSPEQWRVLTDAIFPSAKTPEAVMLALEYCRSRNLDPFKRPVHIVPMWSTTLKRMVETVWPGINELQVTASRSGGWAGIDQPQFGPEREYEFTGSVEDEGGGAREYKVVVRVPEWCSITVHKVVNGQKCAFEGEPVYWLEAYARAGRKSEMPNDMWRKRPRGQLMKCFTPETEILTDQGFQRLDQANANIMQVTKHGLEPVATKPFRQEWFGPMIEASGTSLDFCVTPNHNMVTREGLIEAGALYESATCIAKYHIPLHPPSSPIEAPISDRAIELSALYLTDGYDRRGDAFEASVSRPRKIARITEIAGRPENYTRRCAGDVAILGEQEIITRTDKKNWHFPIAQCEGLAYRGKRPNMQLICSLSGRQAAILVDAMTFYDGSVTPTGTIRFYSSHIRILAAFELACVVAGRSVSRRTPRVAPTGQINWQVTVGRKLDGFVLRFSKSQIDARVGKNNAGIRMVDVNPSGEVWCVTVPSGQIIVRRNGQSMVCGNCAKASALRAAFPEDLGSTYAAEEMEDKEINGSGPVIDGKAEPQQTQVYEEESEFLVRAEGRLENAISNATAWLKALLLILAECPAQSDLDAIKSWDGVQRTLKTAPTLIRGQVADAVAAAEKRLAGVTTEEGKVAEPEPAKQPDPPPAETPLDLAAPYLAEIAALPSFTAMSDLRGKKGSDGRTWLQVVEALPPEPRSRVRAALAEKAASFAG